MQKGIKKWCFLLKICIFLTFVTPTVASNNRKYDVETEALKLYGEDFRSVLRRFRRTPDYLKILSDKLAEMKIYFNEMSLQVLHFYHMKMTQRIGDMVGVSRNFVDQTTAPTTVRVYYHSFNHRRQDEDDKPEPDPAEPDPVEPEPEPEINKEAIKNLDNYKAFNLELTVTERNSYRDMGYEFAGQLIHAIIQNMGPDEPPVKSTRQPGGGENDKNNPTTTEHPSKHEVTEAEKSTLAEVEEETSTLSSTDTFRFRYQPQALRQGPHKY